MSMECNKKTVAAYTLGCKVNQYDTNAMLELLKNDGYTQVDWGSVADLYLINSCTVTNTADKKSRNAVRRAVSMNPQAVVCVCGCLAQYAATEILGMEGVSAVVGTEDRGRIAEIVRNCEHKRLNAVRDFAEQEPFEEMQVSTSGERTRGTIKIQEGCNNFCSYCIIPYVRGRVRSRASESIVAEAMQLAANGVKEIVLTGIHISSYGSDNGKSLLELLRQLDEIDGVLRIRLGSIEPKILTDEFVKQLSKTSSVCPHFHVSLQSGSEAVLERMNRKYTPEQFKEYIATIRKYYKNPAVTTDIITGFPGESEEYFAETARFIQEIGFARIHVFPYSERNGTPAAEMPGAVPVAVRKERARELIAMGRKMERDYLLKFLGTVQNVLFEEDCAGYTDRYVRVTARGAEEGTAANVLLKEMRDDIMIGEVIE